MATDFPEKLGPLDWVKVIDRRTGEEYIAHGQDEAVLLVKEGTMLGSMRQLRLEPPTGLKVRMYTYEVESDEDIAELRQAIAQAVARWDAEHLD